MRPTVRIAFWAIVPHVISLIGSIASAMLAKACVAPSFMACSRLNSSGSIAKIRFAPAALAPWTALMPTPPMPITATLSPGVTSAA